MDIYDIFDENTIKTTSPEVHTMLLVWVQELREVVYEEFVLGEKRKEDNKDKNKNESRIRYLERLLRTAILITEEAAEDEADINNMVTVFFLEDGFEETYKLVTTVRSNSVKARISIESPLGKAIYKHKVGEKVLVKISDAISYFVEIKKIEPTTEEEKDEISKY